MTPPRFRTTATILAGLLAVGLSASPAAAAPEQTGGSVQAFADEPSTSNPVSATVVLHDVVVPPDSLLGGPTFVQLRVDTGGWARISNACDAVIYLCHAQVVARLTVPSKQTSDLVYGACSSGSGCPTHPTGIGKSSFFPRDLFVSFFLNHGPLGINGESPDFVACGEARVYLDLDGDGQWSDDPPAFERVECQNAKVKVSPLS